MEMLQSELDSEAGSVYGWYDGTGALQMCIRDSNILYNDILTKKIKDKKLLTLLKEIIYSADGVPIGNYRCV